MPLDIYASVTANMAAGMKDEGRTRAKHGYICYAPGCPSNAASYGAGYGATEKEAIENATYWANQAAWIKVVPYNKAPQWACTEAAVRKNGDTF